MSQQPFEHHPQDETQSVSAEDHAALRAPSEPAATGRPETQPPASAPRYEAPPADAPRYTPPPSLSQPAHWASPQFGAPGPDPAARSSFAQQAPAAPGYGQQPAPSYYEAQQQSSQAPHPAYGAQQPAYQAAPAYAPAPGVAPGAGGVFDGAVSEHELNRPLYGASIAQALTRFFRNYANFNGRASRSEFWWMMLLFWGGLFALSIIAALIDDFGYGPLRSAMGSVSTMLGLSVLLVVLGTIVPWLALVWRRLHDANLPGPLWFITFFPYLGALALIVLWILPPKPEGRRFDPLSR